MRPIHALSVLAAAALLPQTLALSACLTQQGQISTRTGGQLYCLDVSPSSFAGCNPSNPCDQAVWLQLCASNSATQLWSFATDPKGNNVLVNKYASNTLNSALNRI